jgi:hypothetical protein
VLEETEILSVMTPPGLERFFREASFDFTEQDFTPKLGTKTAVPHQERYGLEIFGDLPDT